ncbi:PREDICTED: uncharacterized protein LOC105448248 [Wasmannia auropunctata]|uniref:uncharacterized protein LOC105448248 n=1 Tax=Wasmannia auropunctata TaxID=64793 RepID=UPI0005EDD795|nr:PREDICTED: uncharacterized protein LOC105448248 [Wasmannia auropunctata]
MRDFDRSFDQLDRRSAQLIEFCQTATCSFCPRERLIIPSALAKYPRALCDKSIVVRADRNSENQSGIVAEKDLSSQRGHSNYGELRAKCESRRENFQGKARRWRCEPSR